MNSSAESELVQRVQSGNAEALTEYVERHQGHLLAVIGQKMSAALKAKLEPEDILQEVVVTALRSQAELDWTDREPFHWLCQLAERRIVDAHRHYVAAQKRTSQREVSLNVKAAGSDGSNGELIDWLVKSMTSPSGAFSRDQREIRMQSAIASLPDEGREAVRMRYVEGRPSKEIAEALGKSDAAVRVLLSRTVKRLHELLCEDPHFESYGDGGIGE